MYCFELLSNPMTQFGYEAVLLYVPWQYVWQETVPLLPCFSTGALATSPVSDDWYGTCVGHGVGQGVGDGVGDGVGQGVKLGQM